MGNPLSTDDLAKKLWDYHHMNHRLEKADVIVTFGSYDIRVAERAAQLFLAEWAPLLLFSGGRGRLTPAAWDTEAEEFMRRAVALGVLEERILIENKSTNSGENILFTKELLASHGIYPKSVIVVHKPYMERRAYAACKKQWEGPEFIMTSPQVSFEEYMTDTISKDEFIKDMVGDLERIKLYPEKRFQIPQEIPHDVWEAYEELIRRGYTKHLVKE